MCELVRQDLDRNLPGEVCVLGRIDLPRAALTEILHDA
jgi:hypothetical protein